jgi:hypothetical protein
MASELPQLRTAGVLAAEVPAPLGRVLYILRTRGIRPIGRAGTLRLYDATAVRAVREVIRQMDERPEVSCG